MIRFFRVNDPYRIFFVILVLIAVRITYGIIGLPLSWPEFKNLLLGEWLASGFQMYTETIDYTAPLSAWTFEAIDWLFGRSRLAHWIISGAILLFQAAFFNIMLVKNKVLSEPIYVPSFLYVIFSIASFDFFALSPQLMSLTWVVISMDHLIRRLDNEASDKLFLYPGFYLGIAGMFYLPSAVFFIVFLLSMIVIVQAKPRRILLYVYGWLTSNAVILIIVYVSGSWFEFLESYFQEVIRQKIYQVALMDMLVLTAFPILFFVFALFSSIGSREGSLHVKTQQFMLLILLAAIGVLAMGGTLSGIDLVFFIPVFTFFITNYFLKIKRRIWRMLIPNLMIFASLATPMLGIHFDLFDSKLIVGESELDATNKKVMVIGPLSPAYLNNTIAGPFIDEKMSLDRLENLDYYHSSMVFLEIFKKTKPDLVLDEWNSMDKIEYRFPEIEAQQIPVITSK